LYFQGDCLVWFSVLLSNIFVLFGLVIFNPNGHIFCVFSFCLVQFLYLLFTGEILIMKQIA